MMTTKINLQSHLPTYDDNGWCHYFWTFIHDHLIVPEAYDFSIINPEPPLEEIFELYAKDGITCTPLFTWHEEMSNADSTLIEEEIDIVKRLRANRKVRTRYVYTVGDVVHTITGYDKAFSFKIVGESGNPAIETCVNWVKDHIISREPTESNEVQFQFVYASEYGAESHDRNIAVDEWTDIRGNYSGAITDKLDRLMEFNPDESVAGKIGILLGPAGTGKTHLIRSLSREWKSWANFKYILDVERFFTDPNYMLEVVLKTRGERKWNVIVCEDSEEYIAPDSKEKIGQSLSRLLNIGDGLIGQGLRLILLFTTNAPDAALHPAITRPGRTFCKIHIPNLSAAEASSWLGSPVLTERSLADLYAAKEDETQIVAEENTRKMGF
jgi:hypothetical protein